MSGRPQHQLGTRALSNWGDGTAAAEHTVGDIFYIPDGCSAVLDDRVDGPGIYRVESCFSIGEDASFYYRVSPVEIIDGKRLKADWHRVSDRLQVIPGKCDYTLGWIRLYAHPVQEAVKA